MSETLCSIQSAQTQKFVSIDGSHLPEVPVVTAGFPNVNFYYPRPLLPNLFDFIQKWIHIRPPPEGRVTFAKVQSPSSLYACPAKVCLYSLSLLQLFTQLVKELVGPMVLVWGFEEYVWKIIETDLGYV